MLFGIKQAPSIGKTDRPELPTISFDQYRAMVDLYSVCAASLAQALKHGDIPDPVRNEISLAVATQARRNVVNRIPRAETTQLALQNLGIIR